jgi:FAD/FMN-containing dehydrogenase
MVGMEIWNAAISPQPAEVVACGTAEEVRAALATAAARKLPVSVLGGGHDWAGRAVRPGGLVIDLTPMRHVRVAGDIATVGGGARSGDVMAAAQEHGLAVAAGTVGAVGMTGLALGSGPAADGADDHEWVALADRELRAHAISGGYPNLLGPDAQEQIRHAYGPNASRLMEVKQQYDPDNVFSATPLPR